MQQVVQGQGRPDSHDPGVQKLGEDHSWWIPETKDCVMWLQDGVSGE